MAGVDLVGDPCLSGPALRVRQRVAADVPLGAQREGVPGVDYGRSAPVVHPHGVERGTAIVEPELQEVRPRSAEAVDRLPEVPDPEEALGPLGKNLDQSHLEWVGVLSLVQGYEGETPGEAGRGPGLAPGGRVEHEPHHVREVDETPAALLGLVDHRGTGVVLGLAVTPRLAECLQKPFGRPPRRRHVVARLADPFRSREDVLRVHVQPGLA